MKNNVTEIVFIIDKSGSMAGLEADTLGGFNAMIEKQKKLPGECFVTTFFFSDTAQMIHDRQRLSTLKKLTEEDYFVGGGTALLDAIGNAVAHIEKIHKYAREEDVPEHTIFAIITDGEENASVNFSFEAIEEMLQSTQTRRHQSGNEQLSGRRALCPGDELLQRPRQQFLLCSPRQRQLHQDLLLRPGPRQHRRHEQFPLFGHCNCARSMDPALSGGDRTGCRRLV